MPPSQPAELFIVDNSDADWKVQQYLAQWCDIASALDIATGYFEVGALLALDGQWQKLDRVRILMGDEVSFRTKRAFAQGLERIQGQLEHSLDREKAQNDFLEGVPAVVEAIRSGKIQCRVYRRDKFHAKAYITHGRAAVVGSFALVGSSNFTHPGLSENVELNVQVSGPEVRLVQDWYERYWNDAEDITPDILRTLERHTRPYTPFEIWFKALDEFFRGRELEPDAWDEQQSTVFKVLDKYQRDAYRNLMPIADRYGGAFLCDGVGLGKTYVGLMLIERLVFKEGKQVVLFAPKATQEDVWEPALRRYLPKVFSGFVNLKTYNHTDLQRKGHWPQEIEMTVRDADVVIIDEAHHFRNPGIRGEGVKAPSRYRQLQAYLQSSERPKQLFSLTATPVNNSIHDFRHIIELFTGGNESHFAATLGIHSLRAHFIQLEKAILRQLPEAQQLDLLLQEEIRQAKRLLRTDTVFDALVVQRSRAYVKESQRLHGGSGAIFPDRELPQVVPYSIKSTYGALLESVRTAFHKQHPLFVLGIYYPLAYWKGDKDSPDFRSFDENRQKQVVTLIRTLFLKRFESSAKAFEASCWRLLKKLLAWVTVHAQADHDKRRLQRWKTKYAELIGYVQEHQQELWPEEADEDQVEDFLDEDVLNAIERLDPQHFDVDAILDDTFDDLEQIADFLREVARVKPEQDDKLKALVKLLQTDPVLRKHKVIIFTEFADTARYLEQELTRAGISRLHRIDGSSSQQQRSDVIRRFSPYYNGLSSVDLAAQGKEDIRVLVSTDILAEGLNLQDATRLINYDLHWNPVRLIQRIGRVDRRLDDQTEARLLAEHPELKTARGLVRYWNFLPPEELDALLSLYATVAHKTLRISKMFGIEGRKLLTPADDYDALREFNQAWERSPSPAEEMRLTYKNLLKDHPGLEQSLASFPLRVFSGREHPSPGARAVFFCYTLPARDMATGTWTDQAGFTRWYLYDMETESILEDAEAIEALIRCQVATPRRCVLDEQALREIRKRVERHIVNTYLRSVQADAGVRATLKAWMELN